MFSAVSDVLRMSSIDHRYSIEIFRSVQDVLRCSEMFTDVFGFQISNESTEFDDPQLFDDPSYSMILRYLMINWKYGL